MEPIILYDIASTLPGQAWSPNTCKTRYCLNYKGISYRTIWVEYPNIESVIKKIGASPTSKSKDGGVYYSLPAIHDPNTNTSLVESAAIAEYLDSTYHNTPKLFQSGTHALQHAFVEAFMATISPLFQFVTPPSLAILNPASKEHYTRTCERWMGKKMEDIAPTGRVRDEEWAKVKAGFDTLDKWLQTGKKDGPFFLGSVLGFTDFVVASFIVWCRKVWGSNSDQWKDMMTWNEGRWSVLIQALEKYETII